MKKIYVAILIMVGVVTFYVVAMASTYKITTGYAYVTCNGVNTGEIELPVGASYSPNNNCTLNEVSSQETLNNMTFTPPPKPAMSAQDLIQQDEYNMAVNDLVTRNIINNNLEIINQQSNQQVNAI